MRRLHVSSITVKGMAVYQCTTCGIFGYGDSVTLQVNDPAEIAKIKPGPNAMPIGWSSYSGHDKGDHLRFRCPNCKGST